MSHWTHLKIFLAIYVALVVLAVATHMPPELIRVLMYGAPVVIVLGVLAGVRDLVLRRRDEASFVHVADLSRREVRRMRRQGRIG